MLPLADASAAPGDDREVIVEVIMMTPRRYAPWRWHIDQAGS